MISKHINVFNYENCNLKLEKDLLFSKEICEKKCNFVCRMHSMSFYYFIKDFIFMWVPLFFHILPLAILFAHRLAYRSSNTDACIEDINK